MLSELVHKWWGTDDESDSPWTPVLEDSMEGHLTEEKSDNISWIDTLNTTK